MTIKELTPDTTLQSGKYTIQSVLGKGGFGITYLAIYGPLKKPLAVKELFLSSEKTFCSREGTTVKPHFEAERYEYFKNRFKDEAITLSRFEGIKGIVQVFEIFEENDTIYLAMEYLRGKNISQTVKDSGPFTPNNAITIAIEVLNTLKAVHEQSILHRDISPSNIIINSNGHPVLLDFGIAREFDEEITLTQTTFLTVGYSAPEQGIERARRGPYTDLYSVGATLYYMLTGERPQTSAEINISDFIGPRELNKAVSPELDKVIEKSLKQRQADRYQTCEEFIAALEGVLKPVVEERRITQPIKPEPPKPKVEEPVYTPPPPPPPAPKPEVVAEEKPAAQPQTNNQTKKSSKLPLIIGGSIAAIAIVVFAVMKLSGTSEDSLSAHERDSIATAKAYADSVAAANPNGVPSVIVNETFTDGVTKFPITDSVSAFSSSFFAFVTGDGVYQFRAGEKDSYEAIDAPIDGSRNFEITCAVRFVDGQKTLPIGIFWGADDDKNKSFRFGIAGNGLHLARNWDGSNDNKFTTVNTSAKAKIGTFNFLTIQKKGDTYHCLLNGTEVYSYIYKEMYGNKAGIFISKNCEGYFDDFNIKYIE